MRSPVQILAILGALATPSIAPARTREPDRPNIVFIFIDDLGYGDLSMMGQAGVPTPNIDRLATEGRTFKRFYVASPICSPSRVGVMTGQYPARRRFFGHLDDRANNRRRGMPDWLDPSSVTITRVFKDNGYAVGHFGKWHMGGGRDVGDAPLPSEYGIDASLVSFEGLGDRILGPGKLQDASAALGQGEIRRVVDREKTAIYVDRAIEFAKVHREEPFYINLWPNDVHDPYNPDPGSAEKYRDLADNDAEARFFAVLAELDRQIGRFVAAVDELGIADRTLIVVTGDNGPTAWPSYYKDGGGPEAAPGSTGGLRGRKWSLYEGGIREPLIVRWPGHVEPGGVDSSTILHAIDLLPSFAAIADVPLPDGFHPDGLDRSKALLGSPASDRPKPLFWEYNSHGGNLRPGLEPDRSPTLAILDGHWKLLMNPDESDVELYDLDADPDESDDRSADDPERAARMKARLIDWYESLPELVEGPSRLEHSSP